MVVPSPPEMFDIASQHLRNRGSVDAALQYLLEAKISYQEQPHSDQALTTLDKAIRELSSIATDYALCSHKFLEQGAEHSPAVAAAHQDALTDGIVGLSYLHGTLEVVSTPGIVSQESALSIRMLLSSLLAQRLYELFDSEKRFCQSLWPEGLKSIAGLAADTPETHNDHLFSNTLRLSQGQADAHTHRKSFGG